MFSIYALLKAAHVVGAIMLMGPAFGYGIIAVMGQRQPQHRVFANQVVAKLNKRMFLPGIAVVIASGLLMGIYAATTEWGSPFGEGWLIASIVITIAALVYSWTFHRSDQKLVRRLAMEAAAAKEGDAHEADPKTEGRIASVRKRLWIGGKVVAYSYGLVALLMVLKPF